MIISGWIFRSFILLNIQSLEFAFLQRNSQCLAHLRSVEICSPRSRVCSTTSSKESDEGSDNSGGKSIILDLLNNMIFVLDTLIFIKFSTVNLLRSLSSDWSKLLAGGRMCLVLSWNPNGCGLSTGSHIREFLRSILTAQEWSSTNFTDSLGIEDKTGLGMDGLRQAPLYFTMKIMPPRSAPWGLLPGNVLG